jgi:uncharacterized phage protein gp47/JayE
MDENIVLNEWVKFDETTGLKVSTQSKIMEDLKLILKSSFGNDFVIQEGSEMFTFLDLLASSLSKSASEYKKIYDSIGFVNATGVTLDNAVSLAGIVREGLVRSYVDITLTRIGLVGTTTISNLPIRIQDANGNNWYCEETITFDDENNSVVKRFYASDGNIEKPYKLFVKAYNGTNDETTDKYWRATSLIPSSITIQNTSDSVIGQEKESDAQLRYRYFTALYNSSSGTVEGIESKILNANTLNLEKIDAKQLEHPVDYVHIYQNNESITNDKYNVPPHSIWVIVDGVSGWDKVASPDTTNYEDDITIAKIIKNFKSLGAGTSSGKSKSLENGEGAIIYKYDEDGESREIRFSRAEAVECNVSVTLTWDTDILAEEKAKITESIRNAVTEYVNGLGINNDVLFAGLSSAIYNIYRNSGYNDYIFDITDLRIGSSENLTTSDRRLQVEIYQYPKLGTLTIN